jgi:hypothetical protein
MQVLRCGKDAVCGHPLANRDRLCAGEACTKAHEERRFSRRINRRDRFILGTFGQAGAGADRRAVRKAPPAPLFSG